MTVTNIPITKRRQGITWEAFQAKYLTREDAYKYEWLNGYVEKTPRSMDEKQLFLLDNLLDFFDTIKVKHKIKGRLVPEIDTFFAGHHRRPDIAFFTTQQIKAARTGDNKTPPQFVIEVISSKDQINRVQKKMDDYQEAEVKVVWHIFPELKKVHVYTGKNMVICKGKDICKADSVIKGFKMSVEDIFKV